MKNFKCEDVINKIQWNQLRIKIKDLPSNVYAETVGRTIFLSRKFIDCIENGIVSLQFFCFVLTHEFIHVCQQAILSRKMTKKELNKYICKNRSCLERMADESALKLILNGSWVKLWSLIMSAERNGIIPLCSYKNVVGQRWLIDGISSNLFNEEHSLFNLDKSRHKKDLFNECLNNLKENEMLDRGKFNLDHAVSSSMLKIESETFWTGIHEKFVRDAIESLEKNGCKKWNDEKLKNSLIHGSHWNDRWNYTNVDFASKYLYGDNFWGKDAFVFSSHGGRMQFLHSMDCSGGSRFYNLKKIKLWTEFCLDVYNKPQIHDMTIEAYAKEKNDPLFNIMMKEIINDKKNFGVKSIKKFFIENPYSKGAFLDYDVGSVAIGTVAHIIHDSFAQSHTKRCLDPFLFKVVELTESDKNEESTELRNLGYEKSICFNDFDIEGKNKCIYEKKNYEKKGKKRYEYFLDYLTSNAMPVILHANYKDQKSAKHKHADLFLKFLDKKDEIEQEDVYKLTLNSTMARDCTELFLYQVGTGADKKEILGLIENICSYYYRVGPVTSSALQYNKENLDEYYDSIMHSLLGYNYKETFSSRISTYNRVMSLLKQIMEKADDDKKMVCACSVYEILNEVYAWTCTICKDFSLKKNMADANENAKLLNRFLDWMVSFFKNRLGSEFDEAVALCKKGLDHVINNSSEKARIYLSDQKKRREKQEKKEAYFIVRIRTGDKFGAGTDAGVYFSIVGENGKKIDYTMLDNIGDSFERNSVEEFEIYSKDDIGNVTGVMVKHDGKYLGSSWFLGNIEIEKMSGEKWTCTANRWVEENKPEWIPIDKTL